LQVKLEVYVTLFGLAVIDFFSGGYGCNFFHSCALQTIHLLIVLSALTLLIIEKADSMEVALLSVCMTTLVGALVILSG
jgi:hypothetical protein